MQLAAQKNWTSASSSSWMSRDTVPVGEAVAHVVTRLGELGHSSWSGINVLARPPQPHRRSQLAGFKTPAQLSQN